MLQFATRLLIAEGTKADLDSIHEQVREKGESVYVRTFGVSSHFLTFFRLPIRSI
ncbi:MAG: hypothetical protein GTN70_01430 [Deltaproteobacteria bacterium]|nr:hypothetical protein [Deltaproteobacteria bacterium]NIS77732.1 hypothetical protein [Deltaproteobacteria bacterium]